MQAGIEAVRYCCLFCQPWPLLQELGRRTGAQQTGPSASSAAGQRDLAAGSSPVLGSPAPAAHGAASPPGASLVQRSVSAEHSSRSSSGREADTVGTAMVSLQGPGLLQGSHPAGLTMGGAGSTNAGSSGLGAPGNATPATTVPLSAASLQEQLAAAGRGLHSSFLRALAESTHSSGSLRSEDSFLLSSLSSQSSGGSSTADHVAPHPGPVLDITRSYRGQDTPLEEALRLSLSRSPSTHGPVDGWHLCRLSSASTLVQGTAAYHTVPLCAGFRTCFLRWLCSQSGRWRAQGRLPIALWS